MNPTKKTILPCTIQLTMDPFLDIIIRAASVYLFMLLAIRVSGKKEISQLSVIDLVLILLISNAVQNAMVGTNSSLSGGLVAAATLFLINYIFKLLIFWFPRAGKVLQGEPVMLIYKGNINEDHLKREHISVEELKSVVREHGVENIEDVDLAVLELNGSISVISKNFSHKTFHQRVRALHPKMNHS